LAWLCKGLFDRICLITLFLETILNWQTLDSMKVTSMNKTYTLTAADAFLITDIQVDFLPGGALPVAGGDEIIPVINSYTKRFQKTNAHIIASRDWHPPNHMSFKAQGGPWPLHCVRDTAGAKFSPDLQIPQNALIISKATDPNREAYSAFDGTSLSEQLWKLGVYRLFVAGLATDYCVVNTVLDARKLGFEAVVLMDATLGIDVHDGDVDRAVESMQLSGAELATQENFPTAADELPVGAEAADVLAKSASVLKAAKDKARIRSKGAGKRLPSEG
jgi:nicotinamidase/pyrazinamidase